MDIKLRKHVALLQGGNKDTPKWARNDNNNLAVESLLKTIGAD